jgi:hypothetical protein
MHGLRFASIRHGKGQVGPPAAVEGPRSTTDTYIRGGVALSGRFLFGTTAALTVLTRGLRLDRTAA